MILPETLRMLDQEGHLAGRSVRSVCLTHYFHVVELDDGSVGAAMNYADLPAEALQSLQEKVDECAWREACLADWLWRDPSMWRQMGMDEVSEKLLKTSLRVAMLSALSVPVLQSGGDHRFVVESAPPSGLLTGAQRAVVIGFGGYMKTFAQHPSIRELHIADLKYATRRKEIDESIDLLRRNHPRKAITISDGHDTAEKLGRADVVAITGSALCNGTLEPLLRQVPDETYVIVQGQSAAIHPVPLFRRGVDLVVTTLKPPELVEFARIDPSGHPMRSLLEGGLPPIYCRGDQL